MLWYNLRWCFLQLNGIKWQRLLIYGLCRFRPHCRPCHLMSCRFRHYVAWSNFDLLSHRVSFKVYKILKTDRIIIIFVYFMGNYVACKKYTKKVPKGFKIFMSTHLELTAKTYVAIGTGTLLNSKVNLHNYICVSLSH